MLALCREKRNRVLMIYDTKTRAAKGFAILSIFFVLVLVPIERIAARETELVSFQGLFCGNTFRSNRHQHPRAADTGISAREQLRRRGSF